MDEVEALRRELFRQWLANHQEHCDNMQSFHPASGLGTECYWPLPDLLVEHYERLMKEEER